MLSLLHAVCLKVRVFYVVFSISRRKGAGMRWRERWPSKINSNWGKHCCCCWFVQKWPSNRIKNDSEIFEHRILREERESCLHVLFYTPWHLRKRKIESHRTKTLSRWPMQTKFFWTKLLRVMRPGVLPMTPKRSDRLLSGLVRLPFGRRNWNSKGPASRTC